ncbi:MAG: hypothetical protein EOP04_06890 [Proteobacteria bacterium]|nr:MAG: hypothetical protein EOP04_06890 [Pseudomonadota bacterium]
MRLSVIRFAQYFSVVVCSGLLSANSQASVSFRYTTDFECDSTSISTVEDPSEISPNVVAAMNILGLPSVPKLNFETAFNETPDIKSPCKVPDWETICSAAAIPDSLLEICGIAKPVDCRVGEELCSPPTSVSKPEIDRSTPSSEIFVTKNRNYD